jgi:hypothetical protein
MKLTMIGCTLLLASTILFGFRAVAAALLNIGGAITGPGMQGMEWAYPWLGWPFMLIPLAMAASGLLCLGLSLWRDA